MLSSESNSDSASARASSVLPTPVGPEEDERADRALRVLDARARADDGVGDELHGLVLADHALVQDLVEAQQLLALALDQAGDRDAGPAGDDLGDLVLGDLLAQQPGLALLVVQALLLGLRAAARARAACRGAARRRG